MFSHSYQEEKALMKTLHHRYVLLGCDIGVYFEVSHFEHKAKLLIFVFRHT